MAKKELEFTTRLTREDVAGLIEALTEGLKDGHLKVQKSDDVLELAVPRVVDLKIEAEIDEERAEFEIEVSWLTNRAGSPDTVPEEKPAGTEKKTASAGPVSLPPKTARARSAAKKTPAGSAPARKKTVRSSSGKKDSATEAPGTMPPTKKTPGPKKAPRSKKDSA